MLRLILLTTTMLFLACTPSRISKTRCHVPQSKRNGVYYSIKQGDSLWKISKQYNLSIESIMRENNIHSPYNLQVGQKIFIPTYRPMTNAEFIWPIKGEILNYFNETIDNSLNRGINIQATSGDQNVKASAPGKVVFANPLKGWGNTIILKHDSSLYTIYANLGQASVKEGNNVGKGQDIGLVASGKNGNYLLHFEVRKKNIPEDPLKYLN